MRDEKTVQTTRRKAREVLYNKNNVSTEERVKAARKLEKTYALNDKRPAGKDAALINQHLGLPKQPLEINRVKDRETPNGVPYGDRLGHEKSEKMLRAAVDLAIKKGEDFAGVKIWSSPYWRVA